ncbi:hypothetical protein PAHAL_5G222600 [Panicum hallii]|uniref:Uncharacterized protein n=1 Tax=Panicum hallii TaxID=206008 RepID=A0A2T8IKW4_9POAL|nr:hypothetical protein PAHAL_5G222600 [Panicum hallii]
MLRVSYPMASSWPGVAFRSSASTAGAWRAWWPRRRGPFCGRNCGTWYGAELQAFGRADFDADGEIPGLGGHLYCKTYLFEFEDEPTDVPPPCWVQKRTK